MAQNDLVINNQSFPSFRSDLNSALQAINTSQSGTSRPSGAVAGTIWLDTTSPTTPTLKYYDGADDISLATLDHSANTVNWLDSTVSITGLTTTATGTVLTLSDSASTSTVNLIIDNQKEVRFRETTANGTNYVALKAPASVSADLTFTLPATDGTSGQALTTNGSGVLSFSTISSPAGFRNIVINGDMQIAQRSTSVASITASGYYTLDRWLFDINSLGTWTMSQSTDVPSGYGFSNSLKLDCTTADASPASGDAVLIRTRFEGQNLQYLKKGTANALPLVLSFWVKSTKTGTFICNLIDDTNARLNAQSYTVSVSNTWEFKTITFPADTTGTLANTNASALSFNFWLGAGTDFTSGTLQTTWGATVNTNRAVGQVNCADSTSNDFLITGVQLEAGTSATDFEFLPIDVSLGRCLRYYYLYQSGNSKSLGAGSYYASDTFSITIDFSKPMRASPSLVQGSGTNFYFVDNSAGSDFFNTFDGIVYSSVNNITMFNNSQVSGTRADNHLIITNNDSSSIAFNAEL